MPTGKIYGNCAVNLGATCDKFQETKSFDYLGFM